MRLWDFESAKWLSVRGSKLGFSKGLKWMQGPDCMYLTNIVAELLRVWKLWSMIWSILYVRLQPSERHLFIKQRNRGESNIYWVMYQTLAVYHMIVPLVYWSLLTADQKEREGLYAWASVSQHTTDGVLMVIEMVSTRILMEIRHVIFAILFLVLYLLMSWVAYWLEGTWIYPFMDFRLYNWTMVGLSYVGVGVVALKEQLGTRQMKKKNGGGYGGEEEGEGEKEEAPLVSDACLAAHVPRTTA
ncbi:hypothetical protein BGX29_010905 [Mortierella sp. GBA35]|nr:hypothetical protein BGX29_010905 [Mortierella sp. GBA35]